MAHKFFQTLQKDHKEVQDILAKLLETSDGSVKSREKIFLQLKQELIPHMKSDDELFYPLLIKNKESAELGMEAMEEHHVAETVLKELDQLSKNEKNWKAKASVFSELVKHHIEEEEDEVFKSAEKMLDKDELDKLMSEFTNKKEDIKKSLK